jgi:hypothetical protein
MGIAFLILIALIAFLMNRHSKSFQIGSSCVSTEDCDKSRGLMCQNGNCNCDRQSFYESKACGKQNLHC